MTQNIFETQFTIQASQERVWDILGIAVMRSLPLEQMLVADESNFTAILMVPLTLFHLSFSIKASLDLDPPNSLVCLIQGKSKWGIVQPTLKVSFVLEADGENKTSIRSFARREGSGKRNIMEWVLRGKEKSFTVDILSNVQRTLERLA